MSARFGPKRAEEGYIDRMRPIVRRASCLKDSNGISRGLASIGSEIFKMAMAEGEKGKLVPETVVGYWEAALAVAQEMKLEEIAIDISNIVNGLSRKDIDVKKSLRE